MRNLILVALLIIPTLKPFAQGFTPQESRVFEAEEIIFFGYDFSHFKLAEIKRLNEENLEKYIPAWIGFLNERRTSESFTSQLKKSKVTFDFDYILQVAKDYEGENMVVMDKHNFPEDSLPSIVAKITSDEKSGIGFIIIPECFEKANKTASSYFVFFDIATREILMSNYYARNEGDGYGMGNYWGQGMHAIIGYYLGDIYRENLKRFQKGKNKKEPSKWEVH